MEEHDAKAYLVNTGWNGTGKYFEKHAPSLMPFWTAALNGSTKHIPIMNLTIPTKLPNVSSDILDHVILTRMLRNRKKKAVSLATKYIKNFDKYCDTGCPRSDTFGPQLP